MTHITYNTVVPTNIAFNYASTADTRGRVSYFIQATCTIGAHKGDPVWKRVIARLVPAPIKEHLDCLELEF